MDLPIVRQTSRYVVVDKPSGLLSVRGKGPGKEDCVPARVLAMFPEATGPMVVHRLDMDTSGLMIVALDAQAQRDLSLQFERRKTFKRYQALLSGHVPMTLDGVDHRTLDHDDATGWPVIDCPIRLDPGNRPYQVHDPVHGKPSQTRFRLDGHATLIPSPRDAGPGVAPRPVTRVHFEPITGRSHQLRVHSAFPRTVGGLGVPIVGDPLYGTEPDRLAIQLAEDRNEPLPWRLMLHASTLGFTEPGTDRWVVCHSPPRWPGTLEPVVL
jgi:tRNA pseudouridine32 synthase/23S rRNA pseudouridine746 synthase